MWHQQVLQKHKRVVVIIGPPFSGKHKLFQREFEHNGYLLVDNRVDMTSVKTKVAGNNKICLVCCDFDEEYRIMRDVLQLRPSECEMNYVYVKPSFGIAQSLWASEFCFAEQMDNDMYNEHIGTQLDKFYGYIKCEYVQNRSVVSPSMIPKDHRTVHNFLFVNRDKSVFSHQGLLIDAHALFTFNPNETSSRKLQITDRKSISYMMSQWNSMKSHTHSRIILLYDDHLFRTALGIPKTIDTGKCIDLIRDAIIDLDLSFPIYYIYVRGQNEKRNLFSTPPNPGLFAFAQYSHSLNMNQSIYVQSYVGQCDNYKDLIPMKHCKYESFIQIFNALGAVTNSQEDAEKLSNDINKELIRILEMPHEKLDQMINSMEYSTDMKSLWIPAAKRFPLLQQLAYDDNITDECYFELKGKSCEGRVHGIILQRKYISYFEEQDDNFEGDLNNTSDPHTSDIEPGSPVPKRKVAEQTQFISPIPKKSVETSTGVSSPAMTTPPPASTQEHKITMTVDQVCQHFGITYFQRGRDYKNNGRISKMKTRGVSSNAFKLYSLCQGSREDPYKQESLFKSGKLLKSICTCPIGEEGGNCKHVCAQLLAYMDKENYEKRTSSNKQDDLPEPQLFSTLNPMDDRWCIKAKVLKKTNIKKWVNQNNSGKVAAVLLKDEMLLTYNRESVNQIKVVMFSEAVDAFYEQFEEGNVYYIAFGNLQHSNPNHTSTAMTSPIKGQTSPYEIHLNAQFSRVNNVQQLGFGLAQQPSISSGRRAIEQPTTTSKQQSNDEFNKYFEKKVSGEDEHGVLEFQPFEDVVDARNDVVRPTDKTSKTKKRKLPQLEDESDPWNLLDEIRNGSESDFVENDTTNSLDDEINTVFGFTKNTSSMKKRKLASDIEPEPDFSDKYRRHSEPVRKLALADKADKVRTEPMNVEQILIDESQPNLEIEPSDMITSDPSSVSLMLPMNTRRVSAPPTVANISSGGDNFKTPKKVSLASVLNSLKKNKT